MTIEIKKSGAKTRLISLAPMNENTVITVQNKLGYNKIHQNDELIDIIEAGYSLDMLKSVANEFGAKYVQI